MSISRRRFVGLGAAAAAGWLAAGGREVRSAPDAGGPPRQGVPAGDAVVVASANGLRGARIAHRMLVEDGADPLDAAIAGVNVQELDPTDQSVGLGGLPNADGVVQLDASCMHGRTRRAGAVAALEGIATPSRVARAVMDRTNHVMLVGAGARRFALDLGFEERNLLTERSRRDWLRWRARRDPEDNWLEPNEDAPVNPTDGTIHMCALGPTGDLGSVTSTSGLSWKIPGRVGDSPIVGAGQYCDNESGAAGATGRGEAAIKVCGAFLVVERMRAGESPGEACLHALRRAVAMTEQRLLDAHGRPLYQLTFYALSRSGAHGAAALYPPVDVEHPGAGRYVVADAAGARLEPLRHLFDAAQIPDVLRRRWRKDKKPTAEEAAPPAGTPAG